MPEHYNYFMSTVEKELQHESNVFKKIKKKIDDYKSQKQQKVKIKNGCTFAHKCFFGSNPKQVRRLQVKTAFEKRRSKEEWDENMERVYTNTGSAVDFN